MIRRFMGAVSRYLRWDWRRLVLGGGIAGLAGLAFCWGRTSALCQTMSAAPAPETPAIAKPGEMLPEAPLAPDSGTDYCRRIVAYIHGNVPITREDLGEYLIARYGMDKVQALVNHKVVEMACKSRGVTITNAEVESALWGDVQGLHLTSLKDFEEKLLKPRNTTLYQWKEDVIRPKLALSQFCRDRVKVTYADVKKAFEQRYGPKVLCRMILIPKNEGRKNLDIYERVRKKGPEGDKAFDAVARSQAIPALAARGGQVPPISQHCGDDRIEKEAFSLNPGEVSSLIDTPDGTIILKCVQHIPAIIGKKIEDERAQLEKELLDQKIMQEIPKVLKDLRAQAKPQFFFKTPMPNAEYMRQVKEDIQSVPGGPGAK